jgi:hypothetical protein
MSRPHNRVARPRPWPCLLCVRLPRSTSDDAHSPIKTPDGKNLNTQSIFQKHITIHRRREHEIGRVQKLFSAPCQRGESPPEVFFITMFASDAMSEQSTLDYGSIAVARWLSFPPCASCLDLVSCLT